MLKPIFPYILVMIMPFPGFERLSLAKNTNATFFGVGGSKTFQRMTQKIFYIQQTHLFIDK